MKHICYGPHENPIQATVACLNAENVDTLEFSQFQLFDLMYHMPGDVDPVQALIQGIFNCTGVRLFPTPFGWLAAYEPEPNEG